MTKKLEAEHDKQEAINELKCILPPGSTVTCVLRSISRSGMSRHIDFYAFGLPGGRWLSGYIARACGYRPAKDGSLVVSGCGMDMGFSVVYNLSSVLYPDGFECVGSFEHGYGRGCPSNDHSNGDRNYEPHHHRDGGYALRSAWL